MSSTISLQPWFILPVAVCLALFCLFLIFTPLLSAPVGPLVAMGFVILGVPVYFFLVMDSPWKIRPRIIDLLSGEVYVEYLPIP